MIMNVLLQHGTVKTIPKDHVVRPPINSGAPTPTASNSIPNKRKSISVRSVRRRLSHFLKDVPRFEAKVTYEQLQEAVRHKDATLYKLQRKCDKKMSKLTPMTHSCIWVAPNGGKILGAYLAYRVGSQKVSDRLLAM